MLIKKIAAVMKIICIKNFYICSDGNTGQLVVVKRRVSNLGNTVGDGDTG